MNDRWWEYYAVRYFVGSVVGALIVAFLNTQPISPYRGNLASFGEYKDSAFLGVSLLGALGFAFCYIASAPMLTLHAARAHLHASRLKGHVFWYSAILLAVAVGASIKVAFAILPHLAGIGVGIAFGVQIALLIRVGLTQGGHVEDFYRQLSTARAGSTRGADRPVSARDEYVTSYRHLREHGNAVAILVLEAILACALLALPSANVAFGLLVAWVTPGIGAWFIGTALESRLVSKPL